MRRTTVRKSIVVVRPDLTSVQENTESCVGRMVFERHIELYLAQDYVKSETTSSSNTRKEAWRLSKKCMLHVRGSVGKYLLTL